MDSYLLPSDVDWPEDKRLMADLSHLNTEITRYIFNLLDADAGRTAAMSAGDERGLGQKCLELGERLQDRATRRDSQNNSRVEGEAGQPRASKPAQDPPPSADP